MITLETLPPVMRRRAEWARMEIMNHPEKVEVDTDEMLAWVFNEEDGVWYSIAGNYSSQSPTQKMNKRAKWINEHETLAMGYKREWEEAYHQQVYWSKIRQNVLDRDHHTCQICKKKGDSRLHVHHVMKRKKGGTDHLDNLLTVCPSCHKTADSKLYDPEWKNSDA